ncbi:MAG: alpha/beta fold hydrolase [Gloeomargarita sp. SKYBB_i_bin120]|nr:alpha/beta fold hydrolase [Gloeomargarita sp. SKYB120]MDW8179270.1 alpha/beta fold hydrolase [Gloeomargarita sp. SKYBB_i_bin120]
MTSVTTAVQSYYRTWQGWRTHWVQAGQQGPAIVLIHGFGASTDHWRYNIPDLARDHRVWAVDLLGFGRSEKPPVDYTGELWREQLRDFVSDVIQEPVFLVGNSLGGYAALCFGVDCPEWTRGVALLNCAGPVGSDSIRPNPIRRFLFSLPGVVDVASAGLFLYMRNRRVIRQILHQVYKDPTHVDDALVESIYRPAWDKGAFGVFRAVFKSPPGRRLDQLFAQLTRPLLLMWGTADPWMTVARAKRCNAFAPYAQVEWLDAGHCPHDERPDLVNPLVRRWCQSVAG